MIATVRHFADSSIRAMKKAPLVVKGNIYIYIYGIILPSYLGDYSKPLTLKKQQV